MLEVVAAPTQERLGTPTTSTPPCSHQMTLPSGVRWRWAVHVGVWIETEVLGPTRQRSVLVVHAGVQLKTSALDRTHWRWVVHAGIGPYMLTLGPTQRHLVVHAFEANGDMGVSFWA